MIKKMILATAAGFIIALFSGQAGAQVNFNQMLEQARQGDVEAMCRLGEAYFYGKGTLKDPFKAKCWIKKAYDAKSVRAQKIWQDLELWQYSGSCGPGFDDEILPRYSPGDAFFDPVTQTAFVYLPNGCFTMGCRVSVEKCRKDQIPSHKVCVDGFWMGEYEVTQRLWKRVMGENPSRFSGQENLPVESISFEDAERFVRRLNARGKNKYVLPTEAQWEYACRKGRAEMRGARNAREDFQAGVPSANCATCENANNPGGSSGKTLPVGSFSPDFIGLYDMAGNVKEWCRDIYSKKAYRSHRKNNPVFLKKGASRVVRGGSFADNASMVKCNSRDKSIPAMRSEYIGLRLVMLNPEL